MWELFLPIFRYACEVTSVWLFLTPGTVAGQAPLSRQEYWSGLPCPPPEDLPHPGIEPMSPVLLYCRCILYCWATRKPYFLGIIQNNRVTLRKMWPEEIQIKVCIWNAAPHCLHTRTLQTWRRPGRVKKANQLRQYSAPLSAFPLSAFPIIKSTTD